MPCRVRLDGRRQNHGRLRHALQDQDFEEETRGRLGAPDLELRRLVDEPSPR